MDANTRMEGIRFSGENVYVSVYSQLTSLDQQGELLSSRCAVYGREMSRATTMTLDQFLFGDEFDSDAVNSVRRHQFDIERDRKKSTTLKVACLQARIKTRDFCVEVEDQIAEYNSLVCMDFHDPTRLDWMKDTLATLPYVYYAGVSSGKTGVFAIFPIVSDDWHDHRHYFDELERITRDLGLNPSKRGRNVTDLRYQSIDAEPYINRRCTRFSLLRSYPKEQY